VPGTLQARGGCLDVDEPRRAAQRAARAKARLHGVAAVRVYARGPLGSIRPVAGERRVELRLPGCAWPIECYLDIEDESGRVVHAKTTSARVPNRYDADVSPKGALCWAARRG